MRFKAKVLLEAGYVQALYGLSKSYNTPADKMHEVARKLAHRVQGSGHPGGENKFLEAIMLWIEVTAPRFFWQEGDTYRLSTKQSESTMHTILRKPLTQENFVEDIDEGLLLRLNEHIAAKDFRWVKLNLPEAFLQCRVWCLSYKTLQNQWYQRRKHKLPEWHAYLDQVLAQIQHPEFIADPKLLETLDGNNLTATLALTREQWVELTSAIESKATRVANGEYGGPDPVDGFDPQRWAADLKELYRTVSKALESQKIAL